MVGFLLPITGFYQLSNKLMIQFITDLGFKAFFGFWGVVAIVVVVVIILAILAAVFKW